MHKGYAFVQFTNPFDARNACHGEDGRTVLSQILGKPIMSIKNNNRQRKNNLVTYKIYITTYIAPNRIQKSKRKFS